MENNWLDNEAFAIRDHERVQLVTERPSGGHYIAVMARSVEMPPGDRSPVRPADGARVEQAVIVACEFGRKNQCWHWVKLSPPTKEFIGDLLFDNGAEKDRWYYAEITDLNTTSDEPSI